MTPQDSPKTTADVFRVGVGSGFSGDRFEPALDLAKFGHLDALVFECLAERTIAAAHERKMTHSGPGFDPHIIQRILQVAPHIHTGVIVTNGGASDPLGAAKELRAKLGTKEKIAAVLGDDVLSKLDLKNTQIMGTSDTLDKYKDRIISANAYLGSDPIVQALDEGSRIVFTGRNSDASLFLAPLKHHYKWQNPNQIAAGVLIGHLLECAGQLTGGYFADGGHKKVEDLAHLGFPFVDVNSEGEAVFSKLSGSGGLLSRATVLEQLLYEIENPASYLTPDLNVDFRSVNIVEIAPNTVKVSGAIANDKPAKFKVSVGIKDGYSSTGQILYSGSDSLARAELAKQILFERWQTVHQRNPEELLISFIGSNASTPWLASQSAREIGLFVALQSDEKNVAEQLSLEVESLYTNGPFGGGGVITHVKPSIGLVSVLIDRSEIETSVVSV